MSPLHVFIHYLTQSRYEAHCTGGESSGSFSYEVSAKAPEPLCNSEYPFSFLLCLSGTSSFLPSFSGLDLPGSLSSSPHARLLGRQGSATSRLCSDGGTMNRLMD